MNITDINLDKKLENQLQFVIEIDKRYYTAGQSPAPAASNLWFNAVFRGKPRGIKPFVFSLARSPALARARSRFVR